MASEYCTAAELHDLGGLPRGALPNAGRLLGDVAASTDTISLDEHGFAADAPLLFRAESGGTLPSPLVAGTTYYAIPLGDSTFQVAASAAGAAINLTTAGSNVVVSTGLPKAAAIQFASAIVDSYLVAHPIDGNAGDHLLVRAITAQLACSHLLIQTGQTQGVLGDAIEKAWKQLAEWRRGVKLRGPGAPAASANAAVTLSASASSAWNHASGSGYVP